MKPRENEESSTTTFDSSSEPMISSSSESQEKRKRGRPKKTEYHPQPQYNPVYNTPLGYQYAPPRTFPITMGYNNSLYRPPMFRQYPEFNPYRIPPGYPGTYIHNITMPYSYSIAPKHQPKPARRPEEPRRKRRSAAIAKELPVPKEEPEEAGESEEFDMIEKLLDYNEEEDTYYVKFRQKSYLHCEWLKREEIAQTRAGAIKIKRFRPKLEPFDPEFVKVDRVLHEDVDEEGRFFLIKWKKLPYEFSTFESEESIQDAENFKEELEAYYERRKAKPMKMSLEWRPSREYFVKFKESPVFKGGNMLRAYQLDGLNWLLNRWYYKQSCIMADEMGLGKTVQSVAFINTLFECYNYTAPVLVISPLSTLIHWEREFKSWTGLRILTFHGSIQGREKICEYEFYLQKSGMSTSIRLFDVLITTYETVMASIRQLQEFDFSVGIFDEAHRLKNSSSKAVTAVKSLNFEHKVLLSGTPLQNNLNELWSLLNFINPSQFSSLQNFLEEFKLEKTEDVERLQNLLRPLMLRRMKEDVEKSIPLKEETIIEVELTMIQKRYYRAILEKNLEFLKKGGSEVAPNLLNAMMELRKCCIHPYLIKGAEESIISDYQKRKAALLQHGGVPVPEEQQPAAGARAEQGSAIVDTVEGSATSHESIQIVDSSAGVSLPVDEYYKVLIQSSGKLVLLDKLLQKLKDSHKVLIFSQMTRCLDLLSDYLSFRKYRHERIDGAVRGENRQAAIDRFSTTDVFVFLLCTRAGGVGINLTAADTVIIFDSDWNPQNDLQAQARCHRIGQTSEVKVYRLITRNTYEREMFDKAGLKLGLDRAVLQKMSYDNKDHKMKKKDAVEILLKKGAYGVLMETDDASRKFCEEDIDQILERRTKIIRHQDGGNVFSKASFQVEEEIDDPDFWENLLSKKEKAENEGRIKRQMRRVAREGVLSKEECERVDALISQLAEAIDAKTRSVDTGDAMPAAEGEPHELNAADSAHETDDLARDKCLLVFLTLLRKGVKALSALKFDTKSTLLVVYQHCLGRIANKKQAEDMTLNMESFTKKSKAKEEGGEEDSMPPASVLEDPLYAEFGVKMLLRVQVPFILQSLLKVADINMERTRGWSTEDDKRLVNWVLSYGYDNYPTGLGTDKGLFRGKTSEDLNQRVRKIILSLKQKSEEVQNTEDPALISSILSFGRVTEKNAARLAELLGEEKVEEMKSLVSKICVKKSRRKRESDNELLMYDRIMLLDRFNNLEVMPTVKRLQGMPRKWKVDDDIRLQELVEAQGLTEDVLKEMGVSEEIALKRIETLVNASVEDDE